MSTSGGAARAPRRPLVSTRISPRRGAKPPRADGPSVVPNGDADGAGDRGKTRVSRPKPVIPNHVRHCHNNGSRDWWLYTWKVGAPHLQTRIPYKCNSWRCNACSVHRNKAECLADPSNCKTCARHDAAVQFCRIREATAGLDAAGWVFLVLTIDRNGWYSGKKWANAAAAFSELSDMTEGFLARLKRHHIRNGWPVVGNQWIGMVEAHRSGWPHLNLLIYSPELAAALAADEPARPADHDEQCRCAPCRRAVLVRGELADLVTGAGWGIESTAQRARSVASIASYIVKLAGEGGAVAGELAKLSQAPDMAPARFRRLRSGKGFLPPRKKSKEGTTGTLIRNEPNEHGEIVPRTLARATWETRPALEQAQTFERAIIRGELAARDWNRVAAACWPEAAFRVPAVSAWAACPEVRPP